MKYCQASSVGLPKGEMAEIGARLGEMRWSIQLAQL